MQENTNRGVGPHTKPWPKDDRLDSELLRKGDIRNVVDKYRYQKVESIKSDMQDRSNGLEIAIENYKHDFNIGTIVRNANAFNARAVHIIGSKQWNKRGAMMTDKYLEVKYHKSAKDFLQHCQGRNIISIDNKTGASLLNDVELPRNAVYVFGSESDGVSEEIITASKGMIAIEQFGSTRSINVGVASGVIMYEWTRRNVLN